MNPPGKGHCHRVKRVKREVPKGANVRINKCQSQQNIGETSLKSGVWNWKYSSGTRLTD